MRGHPREGSEAAVSKRANQGLENKPWKLLLWTAVAGLIFGLIQLAEPLEDFLRVGRNTLHHRNASGDVVLVLIDDKSLRQIGNWPWPRRKDAALIDRLTESGAKRIFLDVNFSFPTTADDDEALANSIRRAGRVWLFTRSRSGIGRS